MAFCDSLGRGGAQAYLGLNVRDLPFTSSSVLREKPEPPDARKGRGHLPERNSCDEVKEAERVHDVPQVGEVVHPVHVPLQHRGDRART